LDGRLVSSMVMSSTTTSLPAAPLRIDHLSKHFGRGRRRVTALQAGGVSGVELPTDLLADAQAPPGARGAAGISPLSIAVEAPDLQYIGGGAIGGVNLAQVLDMGVVAGQLNTLRAGQIAVSVLEADSGSLGVRLGSAVTVYLPDGTPYQATVSAVYSRSLTLATCSSRPRSPPATPAPRPAVHRSWSAPPTPGRWQR
jgi:hypothetical protein